MKGTTWRNQIRKPARKSPDSGSATSRARRRPPGAQHARHLVEGAREVGEVAQRVAAGHAVEAASAKRQPGGVAWTRSRTSWPAATNLGSALRGLDHFLGYFLRHLGDLLSVIGRRGLP